MGLPIYEIEVYQKAPPKVKHTTITQISRLVPAAEKILETCEKSQSNVPKE